MSERWERTNVASDKNVIVCDLVADITSEKNYRKFLKTTITKKWYPVTRLKFYLSLKKKLP